MSLINYEYLNGEFSNDMIFIPSFT